MSKQQKVLEIRNKILSGQDLTIEEFSSEEGSLADYECPKPYEFSCHKCEHKDYCEVLFK